MKEPPPSPRDPITVLVADDHPIFRRGLLETIASDPSLHVVHQAQDGQDALSKIESLQPQVALLDMNMPKLNGLEVARSLSEMESPTALIFLTMYDDEETFNEAMNAGVRGYILKESAASEILQGIRLVAEGRYFISAGISEFLVRRGQERTVLRESHPGLESLTPAERRILKLIGENMTSKEIASHLGISPRTVETHRLHICEKLNVRGVHSLLKFAYENRGKW